MRKTGSRSSPELKPINVTAAAIDIGSKMHMAAVDPTCSENPVRAFGTFTQDLHELADWFQSCGVTSVAMESTGIYWIPAYEILEQRGFEVVLVNARYAKNVPGRKATEDAPIAVSSAAIRAPNVLIGRGVGRAPLKAPLCPTSNRLSLVSSVHSGEPPEESGQADSAEAADSNLIRLVKKVVAGKEPISRGWQDVTAVEVSLCGCRWRRKAAGKARGRTKQVNTPAFDVRAALYGMLGVDPTQIHGLGPSLALKPVGECGRDLNAWPSAKHFTSWLCLAPGNKISGGKVLSSRTRRSSSRAAALLRLAATTGGRDLGEKLVRLDLFLQSPVEQRRGVVHAQFLSPRL